MKRPDHRSFGHPVPNTQLLCPARELLEFDHIQPLAMGGTTTADNLRQRCHAHNQYAADCAFGADFMARQRARAPERERRPQRERAREREPQAQAIAC